MDQLNFFSPPPSFFPFFLFFLILILFPLPFSLFFPSLYKGVWPIEAILSFILENTRKYKKGKLQKN